MREGWTEWHGLDGNNESIDVRKNGMEERRMDQMGHGLGENNGGKNGMDEIRMNCIDRKD